MLLTCRQPSNAGGFRWLAFTKPASKDGKQKKQQVKPALRLPVGVSVHCKKKDRRQLDKGIFAA